MAVVERDPNDWTPTFDVERDGVTQVVLSDGTIKFFEGNYAERGQVDRVEIFNPGQYKPGVTPTVQLVDDNGDNISHNGAVFHVLVSSKGQVIEVTCPRGKAGSGFTPPIVQAKLVAPASDTIEAAEIAVSIRSGQFLDITQSEADAMNTTKRQGFDEFNARTRASIQNQIAGVTDAEGRVLGIQPPPN